MSKKYVITSAQQFARVHTAFLEGLENYCKVNDAKLLVLPMVGQTRAEDDRKKGKPPALDERLWEHEVITRKRQHLGRKLHIEQFNVRPQQQDPTTSLDRRVSYDQTVITASPKQRMRVVPNIGEHPKVILTPGAVTHPRYNPYGRNGRIAEEDHKYGAIVVEVADSGTFHFRHIQANSTRGTFVDLKRRYDRDKVKDATLEALVLGDYHVGDTSPVVQEANYQLIQEYAPRRLFLHDFFNGHSINHHNAKDAISQAQYHHSGRLGLAQELQDCYNELIMLSNLMSDNEVIIVPSNHDDFLRRYLTEGRFIKDPKNLAIASRLLYEVIGVDPFSKEGSYDLHSAQQKVPLQVALSLVGPIPENVTFLPRDKGYKVYGWQLGEHGDKGANGARRSSMQSKEKAYGKSITGHSHTPQIMRDNYVVGTSTHLQLDYNVGPSSWMNTHAMLYNNGKAQLINIIDGKWRL